MLWSRSERSLLFGDRTQKINIVDILVPPFSEELEDDYSVSDFITVVEGGVYTVRAWP